MRRKTAAERKREGSVVDTLNRRSSEMLRANPSEDGVNSSLIDMLRDRLNQMAAAEQAASAAAGQDTAHNT